VILVCLNLFVLNIPLIRSENNDNAFRFGYPLVTPSHPMGCTCFSAGAVLQLTGIADFIRHGRAKNIVVICGIVDFIA
jgi:hypothetical protein